MFQLLSYFSHSSASIGALHVKSRVFTTILLCMIDTLVPLLAGVGGGFKQSGKRGLCHSGWLGGWNDGWTLVDIAQR